MATPKNKHLIELMIEAGVKWPEGAEYAAQDKHTLNVNFYRNGKPDFQSGYREWMANNCCFMGDYAVELDSLCRNWNKTIVTHEQYAEAVDEHTGAIAVTGKSNQVRESHDIPAVDAVEWHNLPSIEQLTADYHAKAAEADRLQAVADEALKSADDALLSLEKAGELLGLVISIDTKPKIVEKPVQHEITDWRDLLVGDVIELTGSYNYCWEKHEGREMTVKKVYPNQGDKDDQVDLRGESGEWSLGGNTTWRFIRRP